MDHVLKALEQVAMELRNLDTLKGYEPQEFTDAMRQQYNDLQQAFNLLDKVWNSRANEEDEYEDDVDEVGFDPFVGGYTYDC